MTKMLKKRRNNKEMEKNEIKSATNKLVVGIDLGTTNSLIAYYGNDGVSIIPNRLGKNLTPSVVGINEENTILVGEVAREYGMLHPDRVADVFKRSMGTEQKYRLDDKELVAEELSAFLLRALKEDAESYLGEEVTEAVISVPAYFDEKRRKATKRAGELAGFRVERIISEPTAAAIAYGLYEKSRNTRFLVFDLGGGTFDISILELFQNILEVRAVAGDNYLGGEDFTYVLERHFIDTFDIDENEMTKKERLELHNMAEIAKKMFSQEDMVEFKARYKGEEKSLHITLREYESLCEPLLEKIRKPVQRSLADAHIRLSEIDEIVLVGGGTKLPVVRNFIVKLFKKFPKTNINPDEAVALGAAIQAAIKERRAEVKEVILTDVCSFTLGTEVSISKGKGLYESGHYCPIIERNTVIPASRTERLYTLHENQEHINVNVLQGESRFAANNLLLGEIDISVPKNKAGAEAVDVTYTYDVNSLLEVEVKVVSTGEKKKLYIRGKDMEMSMEEMKKRMDELSYLKIQPRDQEENQLLLLKGERMYEESVGNERKLVESWINEFEDALATRDYGKINDARRIFAKRLDDIKNYW